MAEEEAVDIAVLVQEADAEALATDDQPVIVVPVAVAEETEGNTTETDGNATSAADASTPAAGADELEQQLAGIEVNLSKVAFDEGSTFRSAARPADALPATYKSNTTHEKETLQYARNFHRQFSNLYAQRRPIAMIFDNECGVQKFISTFIRPTLLPYPQLATHDGIGSFVADYVTFEPLATPTKPPAQLQSPNTTLWRQHGTSLDMSLLLCSLLQGAGYDAYGVLGYATKTVATNSRFRLEKPLRAPEQKAPPSDDAVKTNKYALNLNEKLQSKYEKDMAARRAAKAKAQANEATNAPSAADEDPMSDELFGMRLHSWILVCAGPKDVAEAFFIEPVTGSVISVLDPNYLGIEFVFNSTNLYVNMQPNHEGLQHMMYDLQDSAHWEYVFPTPEASRLPRAEVLQRDPELMDVECAPSWVEPLALEPRDYQTQCPQGKRKVLTTDSVIELYAEYLNENGLVRKVTAYENSKLEQVKTVTSTFKHRQDLLLRRTETPAESSAGATKADFYLPGHPYQVREHRQKLGADPMREVRFYVETRADGALRRVETRDELLESYKSRFDRLVMRQIVFDAPQNRPLITADSKVEAVTKRVAMIVERYARDPDVDEHDDIEEVSYTADAFHIRYFRKKSEMSTATIELEKPPLGPNQTIPAVTREFVDQYHPGKDRPRLRNFEIYELLSKCLKMEQKCRQEIRANVEETVAMLSMMRDHEAKINLQVSFYDTMRNEAARRQRIEKEHHAQEEREHQERQAADYLAPFLQQLADPANLDSTLAAKVRDACLKDLTDRAVERARLIKSWTEREQRALQEKQEWFKQHQASLSRDQEEEYVNFCAEANFRIKILAQRLKNHKAAAAERYAALERQLRSDPRLAPFLDEAVLA